MQFSNPRTSFHCSIFFRWQNTWKKRTQNPIPVELNWNRKPGTKKPFSASELNFLRRMSIKEIRIVTRDEKCVRYYGSIFRSLSKKISPPNPTVGVRSWGQVLAPPARNCIVCVWVCAVCQKQRDSILLHVARSGGGMSPQRQRKATWHWGTVGWKESKKINHGIQLGGFLPWLCFILYVVLRRNIWWNLSCHYGSSIWSTIFGSVFYSSDGLLDPSQNIVRCLDDELPPRFYDIRGFQEANKVLEICLQWNFNFYTSI